MVPSSMFKVRNEKHRELLAQTLPLCLLTGKREIEQSATSGGFQTDRGLAGKHKMGIQRTQVYTFLFLLLVFLQQSCKTGPVTPTPESSPEAKKAEPTAKPETKSESTALAPQRGEEPKLAIEPKPSERFPESIVSAPGRETASLKVAYDTLLMERPPQAGWLYRKDRQSQIVGFEFSNRGGNRILPPRYDIFKNLLFTRDFQFRFDDRARQDIQLLISDWAPSPDKQFRLSELMNSVLHFFPRTYLPAIFARGERYVVILPTGELVEFDAKTREILGGILSEIAVDLNPDRKARQFPGVHYLGKGVVVRANARGSDPRIGSTATISTGTLPLDCEKGTGCNQCQVPAKELWHQTGAVRFRFPTDQEFDRFLVGRCGFGIPGLSAMAFAPEPSPVPAKATVSAY
jgi:hypothetical protein